MADQNTGEKKASRSWMDGMREMMRAKMSEKGGPCCAGMERMARMMASCCPEQSQEESPEDKTDKKEPA
jgi:hypothetical protein